MSALYELSWLMLNKNDVSCPSSHLVPPATTPGDPEAGRTSGPTSKRSESACGSTSWRRRQRWSWRGSGSRMKASTAAGWTSRGVQLGTQEQTSPLSVSVHCTSLEILITFRWVDFKKRSSIGIVGVTPPLLTTTTTTTNVTNYYLVLLMLPTVPAEKIHCELKQVTMNASTLLGPLLGNINASTMNWPHLG